MEFQIEYRIVSRFFTTVEAETKAEAGEKFREIDMTDEVSKNILDGSLHQNEIEIVHIAREEKS